MWNQWFVPLELSLGTSLPLGSLDRWKRNQSAMVSPLAVSKHRVFLSIPHVQSTRQNVFCARPFSSLRSRTFRRTRPDPVPCTILPIFSIVQRISFSHSDLEVSFALENCPDSSSSSHFPQLSPVSSEVAIEPLPPSLKNFVPVASFPCVLAADQHSTVLTQFSESVIVYWIVADCILFLHSALM